MKNDTFLRFGPPNPAGGMSVLNLGDSQIPETAVLPSSRSTDSYLFAKAWTPKACDPPPFFYLQNEVVDRDIPRVAGYLNFK